MLGGNIKQLQRAFTIVETLLFLAITGALILFVSFGQDTLRDKQRFRDAANRLQSRIQRLQEEVIDGAFDSASGTNQSQLIFMKVAVFEDAQQVADVYECSIPRTSDPDPFQISCTPGPVADFSTEWQMVYDMSSAPLSFKLLAVYKHPTNGNIKTYLVDSDGTDITADVQSLYNTYRFSGSTPQGQLDLLSGDGNFTGRVIINPNGRANQFSLEFDN